MTYRSFWDRWVSFNTLFREFIIFVDANPEHVFKNILDFDSNNELVNI